MSIQSDTNLVPTPGISVPNTGVAPDGTTIPNAKPSKFALFTSDWINLQPLVAGAMRLPISTGDFDTKYGAFSAIDKDEITNCVAAFKTLNDAASDFGDPIALCTETATLAAGAKPASLYGQVIWVARQIKIAAGTFNDTYSSLGDILTNNMSRDERLSAMKDILTGPGGLRDTAKDMQTKAFDLQKALLAFSLRIDGSRTNIDKYAGDASTIKTDAATAVADDEKTINELNDTIRDLTKKYSDYCAAAAAGSIGIMLCTGGMAWPLAVADAAVFGTLAEQARHAKNDAYDLLNSEEAEKAKKSALLLDIGGLTDHVGKIKELVDSFATVMGTIAGVWGNQVAAFEAIVEHTDPDILADYTAVQEKLKISIATKDWHQIAADTEEFTQSAYLTFSKN